MEITALHADRALVLALPAGALRAGTGEVARALLAATPAGALPPLVVLDVRGAGTLAVGAARAVVAFARACAERGSRCALLAEPGGALDRVVLDAVDPAGLLVRRTSLEAALARSPEPGPEERSPVEHVVDVPDDEAAEELLSAVYTRLTLRSSGPQRGLRLASAALGEVRFDEVELRSTVEAEVDPLDCHLFGLVRSGRVDTRSADGPRAHGPGDAFLVARPEDPHRARVAHGGFAMTVLPTSLVQQVAPGPEPVRFTGYAPVGPEAARGWTATRDHLRAELLTTPELLTNPLVVGHASRLLAATLLAAFPNSTTADPVVEDRRDAHPDALRRALAFIDANPDRDLATSDVAAAARVSTRAVQLAFRRHLGTTPMAYLRQVRLDHARADLTSATTGQDTVTRIAAKWGYGRASVFAARYRAAYGVSPSQTLRES
ncbi:helix-turn-helix transcriptional regulator [Actinosynnema mirum]|uniref:Transcriptional regulator, AraC family n=2 Tax=Actinosynnema TaxID=40566 RepID=C6WK40_ACTMD|nr:helix-turn-helix transcriptional regulator [Actinosynnema mirum]ACU38253.1 transcriptional regulator, AraC family [Actinosynnema mirum DSM 43827]